MDYITQELRRAEKREFTQEFGERFRWIAAEKMKLGTSFKEQANELGITYDTLLKYRNGQTVPDMLTLRLICDFYFVSADYLLGFCDTVNDASCHGCEYEEDGGGRCENCCRMYPDAFTLLEPKAGERE